MPNPSLSKTAATHLIHIVVTGSKSAVITSYFDNQPVHNPMKVSVGDRIGFYVQVLLGLGRSTPPFTITFSDANFFGVDTLFVAKGGVSQFLQVLVIDSLHPVKYGLEVEGLGKVFDPEIQSGSDQMAFQVALSTRPTPTADTAVSNFAVTWDVGANTVSYTKDGKPGKGNLKISRSDSVTFIAANLPAVPTAALVNFPGVPGKPSNWGSPFDPNGNSIPCNLLVAGNLESANTPVADGADPSGTLFPFYFTIISNGSLLPPSPTLQFELV